MSLSQVRYEEPEVARAFDAVRARRQDSVDVWCQRIAPHIAPLNSDGASRMLIDIGSGTGIWSEAIARRCNISVVGIEPSRGMRRRALTERSHPMVAYVGGRAGALPLGDHSVSGAWMSTVIHQIRDLAGAAGELARVLKGGAPVLIRSSFPGRQDEIELFHRFPAAAERAKSWPALGDVIVTFEAAGFSCVCLDRVREPTFDTYDEFLEMLPTMRASDTALVGIDDEEWERGVASIRRALLSGEQPWPLGLDLLVVRRREYR